MSGLQPEENVTASLIEQNERALAQMRSAHSNEAHNYVVDMRAGQLARAVAHPLGHMTREDAEGFAAKCNTYAATRAPGPLAQVTRDLDTVSRAVDAMLEGGVPVGTMAVVCVRAPLPASAWPRVTLRLDELREKNVARQPFFRDAHGRLCHPPGTTWTLPQWMTATCGELGEAANVLKKIERGDLTLDEARPQLEAELADVVSYLDLFAHHAGIDLATAIITKWNRVSERIGCDLRLEGVYLPDDPNEERDE